MADLDDEFLKFTAEIAAVEEEVKANGLDSVAPAAVSAQPAHSPGSCRHQSAWAPMQAG